MNEKNETYINISVKAVVGRFLDWWVLKSDRWSRGGADGRRDLGTNLIVGGKYNQICRKHVIVYSPISVVEAPQCFALG